MGIFVAFVLNIVIAAQHGNVLTGGL
jgi:hypothetical protein